MSNTSAHPKVLVFHLLFSIILSVFFDCPCFLYLCYTPTTNEYTPVLFNQLLFTKLLDHVKGV